MKENKLEVIIGAVVLAVALGFIVFVYQTTSLSLSNSKHYNLIAVSYTHLTLPTTDRV